MDKNVSLWENVYQWNKENKNNLVYPDEEVIRIIKKFFLPSGAKTVLDAGCGSGRHTLALLREGLEVRALDSSQTALDIASELTAPYGNKVKYDLGNLTCLPFEDASFDAVLCWGVLHYLTGEEFSQALNELYRVLKPDGFLGLTLRSTADSECDIDNAKQMQKSNAMESKNMLFKYFSKSDIYECLSTYSQIQSGHKTRTVFENDERVIAHWYIAAKK